MNKPLHAILTEGSVAMHLKTMAVPMVWGLLATMLMNAIEAFYISHLGREVLAAFSFTFPVVMVLTSVGIGLGGNILTKTNAQGVALIPRMTPYQNNSIRIDAAELPISAEIDSIEQTAVPAYRSAVKVVFPVRTGRGALIKINLADGEPAPAGATVYLAGDKQEFYVARRGEAYVTGLETTNRLQLKWKDQSCQLEVTLPAATDDNIARVGPVICQGVAR